MKENKGFDFSQLILLVPVIMLAVLVLPGKNGGTKPAAVTEKSGRTSAAGPVPKQESFSLDGPLACGGETEEGTVSALIKDKNIIATVSAKTSAHNYLLNGDCIYSWEWKAKTGTKICGVGGLLPLAGTFLSGGFGSADTLLSGMGIAGAAIKADDAKSIMKSCGKAVIDPVVFKIPAGVQFKTQTSSQLLPVGK